MNSAVSRRTCTQIHIGLNPTKNVTLGFLFLCFVGNNTNETKRNIPDVITILYWCTECQNVMPARSKHAHMSDTQMPYLGKRWVDINVKVQHLSEQNICFWVSQGEES